MSRIITIILALLFILPYARAQGGFGADRKPRLHALVMGVSRYQHAKSSLKYAHRDAQAIHELLGHTLGVETDPEMRVMLLDSMATAANLNEKLTELSNRVKNGSIAKGDYIVIFFSGHGMLEKETGENRGCFLLYDNDVNQGICDCYHSSFSIPMKILLNKGCRVFFIADACHAGRMLGKKEAELVQLPDLSSLAASGDDRLTVMTSSSGAGRSFEDPSMQHGAFTWYLIEAALGNADVFPRDGVTTNLEINGYVVDKLRTYNQIPEISNLNGNFLSFDTTAAPLAFQSVAATPASRTIFEKKLFGVTENLPADTALISLYYRNLKALRLFGSDSAAFDILKKVKGSSDSVLYYEKMRVAFVKTALNEDNAIIYRYLNQDVYPWKSKYDDIEQGLRICLALQETLDTLDFKFTEVASRYLFYQAMAWYEYAKFSDSRSERSSRLNTADTLINQVSVMGALPVLTLFQKNLIENGLELRGSDTLLQKILEIAPDWRLPRLYSGDLAEYRLLLRDDYRASRLPFDTLPALDVLVAGGKTNDASRISELFSGNPQLAEDVYLQYALREKNVERALRHHRQLLERSLRTLAGRENLHAPGEPGFFGELGTYSRQNRLAFAKMAEEQFRLTVLTGDEAYERLAREMLVKLAAAGASLSGSSSGEVNNASATEATLPGSVTDSLVGNFTLVRGGTFEMGCTYFKNQCSSDETPVHPVTIGSYYIGKTEVTQKQWRAVMGSVPDVHFSCDDCPVERVSWDDALLFIEKLNTLSSGKYRLPTEAEWEYAAKGGHQSLDRYNYAGGFDPLQVSWFEKNSGNKTHPVGKLQPNELGLYDMSGNVSEWCSDEFRVYSGNRDVSLLSTNDGDTRVNRGGSWNDKLSYCRVSNRSNLKPDSRFDTLGFRLVREVR